MSEFQSIKNNAKSLFDRNKLRLSRDEFLRAYALDEKDVDVSISLGLIFVKLEDIENAQLWLERADNIADSQGITMPSIGYFYMANIYRQRDETDKAIEYYQLAISIVSEFPLAHLMVAGMYLVKKELDDAEYHYKYVIKLQPDNADALANLAQVYELLNQDDNARSVIKSALMINSSHAGALMALGKLEKRVKNYLQSKTAFGLLTEKSVADNVKAIAYLELGHVLDKLKQYDEAFYASSKGKVLWEKVINTLPFDKQLYQRKIADNQNYFTADTVSSVAQETRETNDTSTPIFFVGCPRSGTTLAEQVINQHKNIITSDEKPFISELIDKIPTISSSLKPYPSCLDDLSDDETDKLRQLYWQAVKEALPEYEDDNVLLDKMPMNIIELGFIKKLFPEAKIIVALRDPRDVCLSCFMQAFTPNPAMINFLNLESTVNFYSQIMSLWLHYKKIFSGIHQYRYEDLVSEFETTTRGIFTFLNLEYPDNAAEFHLSAANRVITTPSYQDVATPIYQRSKARWINYENHISPYQQQLSLFIDEFGYS